MPLCTLHLLSLKPSTTPTAYLAALPPSTPAPLLTARPIRWIIRPTRAPAATALLLDDARATATKWDLLLILPGTTTTLPNAHLAAATFALTAGVPGSVLAALRGKNEATFAPGARGPPLPVPVTPADGPEATGKPRIAQSAQNLELTDDLARWADGVWRREPGVGDRPVSMLNFLAFKEGKEAREGYARYGRAFAAGIGSKRGGDAKIVGKVVGGKNAGGKDAEGWDEVAVAQYPSLAHFCDMAGSRDYQAVNQRDRLPALRDTCILMTTEVGLGGETGGAGGGGARL